MPSPFLDANPSFTSLLTSAEPPRSVLMDGEYISFTLQDFRHRVIFESGLRPVLKGKINLTGLPRVGFSKGFRWIWLSFLLVRDSRRYWSRRRYQVYYPQGGTPSFPWENGTPINNLRRMAQAQVNPPPGKRTGGPRTSTPRPNPEVRSKFRQNFSEGNNGGYFFSPSLSSETTYTRTWTGSNTPGFGSLKKGQKPVNNHSVTISDIQDSGLIEMFNIPSTGVYFNQYSAWTRRYTPPVPPSHDANAVSKALKKLAQRMESGIEGNLAQDVVQIRQTVKLITDTAKRLANAGLSLKNGNIPGAARALWGSKSPYYGRKGRAPDNTKNAADNWLQMQYGWKPLLQDLHGAMEAIARLHLSDASIKQVTASANTNRWDVNDLPLVLNPEKVGGWIRVQTQSRCKFGIRFTVDNHLLAFLAQSGFTNPVNLVWEVIPFSFVADWFLPIGPWLETLSAYHGLVFLDGYQTRFTKQRVESLVRFNGPIGSTAPGQDLQTAGQYSREVVLLDRAKLNSFPTASFPSFKSPLSVTHALNALALLKSVFR